MPRISIDIPLRVLAILLVVVHREMLWPIPGGSALMLVLVGFFACAVQTRENFIKGNFDRPAAPLDDGAATVRLRGFGLRYRLATDTLGLGSSHRQLQDPPPRSSQMMLPYLLLVRGNLHADPADFYRASLSQPYRPGMPSLATRSLPGLCMLFAAIAARLLMPLVVDIGNRRDIHAVLEPASRRVRLVRMFCGRVGVKRQRFLPFGAALFFTLGFLDGVWIGTQIKAPDRLHCGLVALLYVGTHSRCHGCSLPG